eukprot:3284361-Pyramimonas_sp.AAC.1
MGWHSDVAPADLTNPMCPTSDTMALIKKHSGFWLGNDGMVVPGRLASCVFRTSALGAMQLFSVYLQDQVQLHEANRTILSQLWKKVSKAAVPFAVGGDVGMAAKKVETFQPRAKFAA